MTTKEQREEAETFKYENRQLWLSENGPLSEGDVLMDAVQGREYVWVEEEDDDGHFDLKRRYLPDALQSSYQSIPF